MPITMEQLLASQDQLISRRQALVYLEQDQITRRLGSTWPVILPGIYATFTGALTDRHRLRAGLLHGGNEAVLSDTSALGLYGIPFVPPDQFVRVLVPNEVQRASRDFVVVRRTKRPPAPRSINGFPVAPLARAVCEFGGRHPGEREALAVMAAAMQTGRVSLDGLQAEIEAGPNRGKRRLIRMFGALAAGVRSAPEADFVDLVRQSRILPPPLLNAVLHLPDGEIVRPDALFVEAALIHETNGHAYHSSRDDFAAMQARHDRLVAAGFVVLHNSPSRLAGEPRAVLAEVEQVYQRCVGRGLPPGVTLEPGTRPHPPDRQRSRSVA